MFEAVMIPVSFLIGWVVFYALALQFRISLAAERIGFTDRRASEIGLAVALGIWIALCYGAAVIFGHTIN